MASEKSEERTIHKVDATKVKPNDLMAFVYWVKINSVTANGDLAKVTNTEDGQIINFQGKALIENGFSADQYHEEQKVTKTKIAEMLISSFNRPFTVKFTKQDGTERTLRGKFLSAEHLLGRSNVIDLDSTEKNALRQVDHRTISSLILEGVRYYV